MNDFLQKIINWFKEFGLPFHMFNWGLPAILPILAVCLFSFVAQKMGMVFEKNNYINFLINFGSQLFYFSFLLLINNAALYYLKENNKQKNDFTISITFAMLLLLFYTASTIFIITNCKNCGFKTAIFILLLSIIVSIISIYLYSRNIDASYRSKSNESALLSEERSDKSRTLENRIKSNDDKK